MLRGSTKLLGCVDELSSFHLLCIPILGPLLKGVSGSRFRLTHSSGNKLQRTCVWNICFNLKYLYKDMASFISMSQSNGLGKLAKVDSQWPRQQTRIIIEDDQGSMHAGESVYHRGGVLEKDHILACYRWIKTCKISKFHSGQFLDSCQFGPSGLIFMFCLELKK